MTAFALRSTARSLRGRRRLWPVVVLAVSLAGAAGAAPAGIGPVPPPKPGRVVSSPFPHSVSVTTEAAVEADDGSIVVAGASGASWTDYEAYSESALRARPVPTGRKRRHLVRGRGLGARRSVRRAPSATSRSTARGGSSSPALPASSPSWPGTGRRAGPTAPSGSAGSSAARPERLTLTRCRRRSRPACSPTAPSSSSRSSASLTSRSDPAPGGLTFTRLGSDGAARAPAPRAQRPSGRPAGIAPMRPGPRPPSSRTDLVVVAGTVADPRPFTRPCPCEAHSLVVIRRFAADGTVDRSFGTAGRTMTRIGEDACAADVVVAPDGTVVASGASGQRSYAAVRFRPNGTLDRAFASDGIFALDLGEGHSGAEHVAFDRGRRDRPRGKAGRDGRTARPRRAAGPVVRRRRPRDHGGGQLNRHGRRHLSRRRRPRRRDVERRAVPPRAIRRDGSGVHRRRCGDPDGASIARRGRRRGAASRRRRARGLDRHRKPASPRTSSARGARRRRGSGRRRG